jgi:hypothetical protein
MNGRESFDGFELDNEVLADQQVQLTLTNDVTLYLTAIGTWRRNGTDLVSNSTQRACS